jgi:hypothetical protein
VYHVHLFKRADARPYTTISDSDANPHANANPDPGTVC